MQLLFLTTLSILFPAVFALPRPQDSTSCGTDKYTVNQIKAAQNAACKYVQSETEAGSSTYPHTYRDDEGFAFAGVSGPYYEFPILKSGKVYSGGMYIIFSDMGRSL
jgi:hypothetical protein